MFSGVVSGFVRNVAIVARAFLPVTYRPMRRVVTPAHVALIMVIWIAANVLSELGLFWPIGGFERWGVTSTLASLAVFVLAVALAVAVAGKWERFVPTLFAALTGSILVVVATTILLALRDLDLGGGPAMILGWSVFAILISGLFRIMRGWGDLRAGRSIFAVAAFLGVMVVAAFYLPRAPLFYPDYGAGDGEDADVAQLDVEKLYYAQPTLMHDALGRLTDGEKGRPDLFAILGAGTAYQGVFLSEVTQVRDILRPMQNGREDRTILLANSIGDPFAQPLLGRENLRAALRAVAERADPDEDATLIYLTSHGGKDSFSLGFWQAGLDSLSAKEFSAMLAESGLRHVVVVIAACYSGSFIDDISAPDRLVITAAAADRVSFGCAAENEWTDFGRAYFDEALRSTGDFRVAFDRAAEAIAKRETERALTASQPQMVLGDDMAVFLDRVSEHANDTDGLLPKRLDTAASRL